MEKLDYRLVGRETTSWQKKYFFREVGRPGNPDSAFILLLASQRKRGEGTDEAAGSDVFARLVDHYGREHLTRSPREVVRRLVDIASAAAVGAEESKTELAAGFLHIKGRRAAAGSVGRLRAGLADRESIVATSPLPDRAGKKGGAGQVALDLGQTIEGDLEERPAFFIAPSSAVAVGDEGLRRFLWDMVSSGGGIEASPPADWKHLPCLVGAATPDRAREIAPPPEKPALKRALSTMRERRARARRPAAIQQAQAPAVAEPPAELATSRVRAAAWRTALWVCLVAVIAFFGIRFGLGGRDGQEVASEQPGSPATAASSATGGAEGGKAGGGAEDGLLVAEGTPGEAATEAEQAGLNKGTPGEAGLEVSRGETALGGVSGLSLERLWRRGVGGVLTSSPVDVGDAVAFGSRAGVVHCLAKSGGETRWSFKGPDGFGSSPAAAGGRIYIGCYDGEVFCLNARDGSRVWSYKTGARVVSSPAIGRDGSVLVGSYDGYLYCLYPDGGVRWRFNSGARIWSSPVECEGKAVFADVTGRIRCLDSGTGRALWSRKAGGAIHGSPAAEAGLVWFGSADGTIAALAIADGSVKWTYKGDSPVSSSVALGSGSVFAGYEDGSLVRLSESDGAVAWRARLPGPVRSRPLVLDGAVVMTCYDGLVRMLDITTGDVISSYNANGKIYATPLLASNTLYFGDMTGAFTALEIASSSTR